MRKIIAVRFLTSFETLLGIRLPDCIMSLLKSEKFIEFLFNGVIYQVPAVLLEELPSLNNGTRRSMTGVSSNQSVQLLLQEQLRLYLKLLVKQKADENDTNVSYDQLNINVTNDILQNYDLMDFVDIHMGHTKLVTKALKDKADEVPNDFIIRLFELFNQNKEENEGNRDKGHLDLQLRSLWQGLPLYRKLELYKTDKNKVIFEPFRQEVESFEEWLAKPPSKRRIESGNTLLMELSSLGRTNNAIEIGNKTYSSIQVMEALIKSKLEDMNAKDKRGYTTLMLAAGRGYIKIVELLIKAKADVNAKTKYGRTALSEAALGADWEEGCGCEKIVDLLLAAGANLVTCKRLHTTALMVRNTNILKKLLKAGADADATNEDGETALMRAVECRRKEIVDLLIKFGADVNDSDSSGSTALTLGVNQENMVKKLLDAGAKDNGSALIKAAKMGNQNIVELLLEPKADVKGKEEALRLAGREGHINIVKKLLEAGADVNASDQNGRTALMRASETDYRHLFRRPHTYGYPSGMVP